MQMKHSSLTIQEAAEAPAGQVARRPGPAIASDLAAGWIMAQYAVTRPRPGSATTSSGRAEEGPLFPEGMDPAQQPQL